MSLTKANNRMIDGATFNALDFGAIGDGVADDTAAIQAALNAADAADGGIVYCPTGTYKITSQIQVNTKTGIVGEAKGATRFLRDNAGYTFKAGGSGLTSHIQFNNFSILLSHPDANGIQLASTQGADVKNLYIEGYIPFTPITYARTNVGMYIDTSGSSGFFNTFVNVVMNHLHTGWKFDASGASQTTCQTLINCTCLGDLIYGDTTSVGIEVNSLFNGSESIWLGGNLESCGTGVKFGQDTGRMTFTGMRFEANTTDIEFGRGSQSTTWVGCRDIRNITDNSGVPETGAQPPASTHQFIGCANAGTPIANEMFKVLAKQNNSSDSALVVTTEDPITQPWQNKIATIGSNGIFSGEGIYKQGYNGTYYLPSVPTTGFRNKTWAKGDVIWNTSIVTGGTTPAGWRCLTSGTFAGPNPAGTGGTVGVVDVNLIKNVLLSNNQPFVVGQQVTVSAGFATTGPFYITKVINFGSPNTNAQWIYINATATTNATGVTLATVGVLSGSGGTTNGTDNVISNVASGQPFRVGQLVNVSAGFSVSLVRIEKVETVSNGVQDIYVDQNSNAVASGVTVTVSDPTFVAMANIP